MKRALFKSVNLLGDGLYVGPVAEQWYRSHGSEYEEIHLLTIPNHARAIYDGMGVPWKVVYEPEGEYDLSIDFNVSEAFQISDKKKCHLVNAYAELAGIPSTGLRARPNYNPPFMDVAEDKRGLAIVSLFSMSCSSRENPPKPPNKMLPWEKWRLLLDTLRREYPGKLRLMGAPTDIIPEEAGLNIQPEEYLNGVSIPETANIMRYAKLCVNVDNGMGHLAAAMKLPEFLLVPAVLSMHYIVPWGHMQLRTFHMDPVLVDEKSINNCLESAIKDWKELDDVRSQSRGW